MLQKRKRHLKSIRSFRFHYSLVKIKHDTITENYLDEIDTVRMTISITNRKKERIYELCDQILSNNSTKIRHIACLLGNFSAAFEGVPYGRLHFRNLEHDKIRSLKKHIGS